VLEQLSEVALRTGYFEFLKNEQSQNLSRELLTGSSLSLKSTGVYWIPLYDILEARGLPKIRLQRGLSACESPLSFFYHSARFHICLFCSLKTLSIAPFLDGSTSSPHS
jgi:hypothetical protein